MIKYYISLGCVLCLLFNTCQENNSELTPTIACADYCEENDDFNCTNGECKCKGTRVLVQQKFCTLKGSYLASVSDFPCIDDFSIIFADDEFATILASDTTLEVNTTGEIMNAHASAGSRMTGFSYYFDGVEINFSTPLPTSKDMFVPTPANYTCYPEVGNGTPCELRLFGRISHPDTIQARVQLTCDNGLRNEISFPMIRVQ